MTLPVVAVEETADAPALFARPVRNIEHAGRTDRYLSPLRYPGAKSRMAPIITDVVKRALQSRAVRRFELFIEPFAGGASTSLRLLSDGLVERALLADADPLVASFWKVAAHTPGQLNDLYQREWDEWISKGGATALERWDYWRAWQPSDDADDDASLLVHTALRCLFLNRTTFSGILHGKAGPLGGRTQSSEHHIGCRFYVDRIQKRIDYVGHLYAQGRLVDVLEADWQATMDFALSELDRIDVKDVLVYLDPPYVDKGADLYTRAFGPSPLESDVIWQGGAMDHMRLAGYLRQHTPFRWLLSYDNHPALLANPLLYAAGRITPAPGVDATARAITKRQVSMTYTASAARGRSVSSELLLTTLPASSVPDSEVYVRVP